MRGIYTIPRMPTTHVRAGKLQRYLSAFLQQHAAELPALVSVSREEALSQTPEERRTVLERLRARYLLAVIRAGPAYQLPTSDVPHGVACVIMTRRHGQNAGVTCRSDTHQAGAAGSCVSL